MSTRPTNQQNNKDPPRQASSPNELHVVTENGEQCFMWRSGQLTYIAPNRQEIPFVLATKFGHLATKLDLSYNNLTSFRHINLFTNLNELILDNNCLEDDQLEFRQNLRLKTLSLNKNKICDLYKLIINIKVCFPNLEFLSLIGNKFCPIKISSATANEGARSSSGSTTIATAAQAAAIRSRYPEAPVNDYYSVGATTTTSQPVAIDLCDSNEICNTRLVYDDDVDDDKQTAFANQKYRYFIINHLPNLHFLDSSPIGSDERDEALNSCFWLESSPTPTSTYATDGKSWSPPPSIIWGQTIQNEGSYFGHSTNINVNSNNNSNNGTLNGCKMLITQHDHYYRGIREQLQFVTANGEHRPKGQFSQQVKCQMVGSFKFARTLLWTLISLTSTNLVHCSGALLALSFKDTVNNKNRLQDGKKKRDKK